MTLGNTHVLPHHDIGRQGDIDDMAMVLREARDVGWSYGPVVLLDWCCDDNAALLA